MNYAVINKMDIANGPGVRVSMFVSGCNFHCKNCFNKEEQDFNFGAKYTKDSKDIILKHVAKPFVTGLSLLGGDPLWQDEDGLKELISLVKEVKKLNKTVWIWSGFVWEQIFPETIENDIDMRQVLRQELIKNCDVYVDGLFVEKLKDPNLKWCGSSNQRVINISKTLEKGDIVLYD